MFCLQSTKANGMKTSFEACRQKVLPVLNDYSIACRAVARTLIGGGGGVYSYIHVLPD